MIFLESHGFFVNPKLFTFLRLEFSNKAIKIISNFSSLSRKDTKLFGQFSEARFFGPPDFFQKSSKISKWLRTWHGVKFDLLFHIVLIKSGSLNNPEPLFSESICMK